MANILGSRTKRTLGFIAIFTFSYFVACLAIIYFEDMSSDPIAASYLVPNVFFFIWVFSIPLLSAIFITIDRFVYKSSAGSAVRFVLISIANLIAYPLTLSALISLGKITNWY